MKFRVLLFLMVLCVLGAGHARATWQISDILIYEGKEYPILNTMMSSYFDKHPDRNPKDDENGRCSGSWRGYQAVFEVSEGAIYLKDIFGKPCRERESVIKKVVPDGKRLTIDWYTGFLISVGGDNQAELYSDEFLDSFEKYAFFQVDSGKIGKVLQLDNKGYISFKKRQFEGYKKTNEYREAVKRFGDKPRKEVDDGIYSFFLMYMDRFYID